MARSKALRMKGKLRSRFVRRKAAVRKKRILRTKVRHHTHRRYAGVRGLRKGGKKLRRTRIKPHKHTAKRRTYKAKPKTGQGLPPISVSAYMSMF